MQGGRGNLSKGGVVTLAVVGDAALHQDGTIAANTYGGGFTWNVGHGSGIITGKFDKSRKANTQQHGVNSHEIYVLFGATVRVIGCREDVYVGRLLESYSVQSVRVW